MEDVTLRLLNDLQRVRGYTYLKTAKPAKSISVSQSTIIKELQDPRSDNSMGFISNVLVYSNRFREKGKRYQADIIRLLKGNVLLIIFVKQPPEEGSVAKRDSPYSHAFYNIEINPELM